MVKEAGNATKIIESQYIANFDNYFSLLIVVPEEVESFECVNILNYFNFPMKVEEDNIVRKLIKKEMAFDKEDPYPCLMVDSNNNDIQNLDLSGTPQILQKLLASSYIGEYKSHSANER